MASTSTLNAWLDELANSITKDSLTVKPNKRRVLDNFRRRVRYHNCARTNQFEVEERLTGLEEKFQILNRDELSDELYRRRIELRSFQNKWIPDVLDLLLKLAGDPTKNEKLLELYSIEPKPAAPPPLKWKDLQSDDPIDPDDELWKIPEFTDYSSDEDDFTGSSSKSSPLSKKVVTASTTQEVLVNENIFITQSDDDSATGIIINGLAGISDEIARPADEIQLVREVLFLLRGVPTPMFEVLPDDIRINANFQARGVHRSVVKRMGQRMVSVKRQIDDVQQWIDQPSEDDFIQVMKQEIETTLRSFYVFVDQFQSKFLKPTAKQPVSLLDLMIASENASKPIEVLSRFVQDVEKADSVSCLERLYAMIVTSQHSCEDEEFTLLGSLFASSFTTYLRSLWTWVLQGRLPRPLRRCFIRETGKSKGVDDMWNNWFMVSESGSNRAPKFMKMVVGKVFICGKTAAFIRQLNISKFDDSRSEDEIHQLTNDIRALVQEPLNPFSSALETIIARSIGATLQKHTEKLKAILHTACGLGRTLNAFDNIYLRKNGVLIDKVEGTMFDRIDRCVESWNDRFLVADMLEELYKFYNIPVDPDSVVVYATYTSSRSMQSRRQSVKILNALAVGYILPWPVANIIPPSSMQSYQRISLTLTQIRRAKYALERIAYHRVQNMVISEDATAADQKHAQVITFILLQFVNNLYDHFTTGVILPMTTKMRTNLEQASSFDDIIHVHKVYIERMEYACLASPKLKMLKEALIALLDLCIRFSDLVSDPERLRKADPDIEAISYASAQSRRRRRRAGMDEESDTDADDEYGLDDEGNDDTQNTIREGFSSFIVLDEGTTVVEEIRKLQMQFGRQMDFFVAGLRGLARGTDATDEFEMLSERLSWKR